MSDNNPPAAANQEDDDQNNPPPPPQQIPRNLEFDMFMMYEYRTSYCPPEIMQQFPHNPSLCPNVHPGTTRRRDPRIFNYSPEFCDAIPEDCEDEEDCEFSHNILEHCLHPRKYRKTRCFEGLNCKVFPCLFPHNPIELNRGLAKPPLYPLPPIPPPPCTVLSLPGNLIMPPPGNYNVQLMGEGVLPRVGRSKRRGELRPPRRYRHRLPPLPKRKNDDEASSSRTKKEDDGRS